MSNPLHIGIAGAAGRMGQALVAQLASHPQARLSIAGSRTIPSAELFSGSDAVIDFTSPDYSLEIARTAAELGKIHIIGTTGFSADQMQQLKQYAQKSRTVWSSNMSACVHILAQLVERAAQLLGPEFDIEIAEMHHAKKKDSPSGTALLLGEAAAKGRSIDLAKNSVRGRDGIGDARARGAIGFSSLRGGDVVGDHSVIFAGPGEIVTLSHRAQNRDIFASGAIRAALWAHQQPPGFYTMRDVVA